MAGQSSRGAGSLTERVVFERRATIDNEDGNVLGSWVPVFEVSAGYIHLRGGEDVMAGRLQGQHVQVIFVRSSSDSRAVDASWRVRDKRTGDCFNIRDVTPTTDRKWIDLLCQRGVAEG